MISDKVKNEFNKLVKSDKLNEAFTLLYNETGSHQLLIRRRILSLSNRYYSLKNKEIKGIISFQEYELSKNKIVDDLLSITDYNVPNNSYIIYVLASLLLILSTIFIYYVFYLGNIEGISSNNGVGSEGNINMPLTNQIDEYEVDSYEYNNDNVNSLPIKPKTNRTVERQSEVIEKQKEKVVVEKEKFSIFPRNDNLIRLIEGGTELKFSMKSPDYRVSITHTGQIESVRDDGSLHQYSGGNINILVNDNPCIILDEFELDESMRHGNPKKLIIEEIERQIKELIGNNSTEVAEKIIKCLE